MFIVGSLLIVIVAAFFIFINSAPFGRNPTGERLSKILRSPNYQNGAFQNPEPTDIILKDVSYPKMMVDFFFNKPKSLKPLQVPTVHTDLKKLDSPVPAIVWFGHSSYLIKTRTANILVDPVLKGNVSPVSFFGKPFPGADAYPIEDLPSIDIVLLTHDHYDHLHYQSIQKLSSSVKYFVLHLELASI